MASLCLRKTVGFWRIVGLRHPRLGVRTAKLFNNFLYRNICAMTKERILLTSFLNQVGNKGIYGW